METMSRQLDVVYKISRYVKYWKHLAEQLGISKEIYEKFCEVKQSPTEDLFYYVFASMPHLTLAGFCEVLSSKGRNDVLRILKLCMEGKYTILLSDFFSFYYSIFLFFHFISITPSSLTLPACSSLLKILL